ncbi:hypothetical protein B0J11DRAFT_504689 [Dendryphion nanum]|uniref:Uncharacterized protein n=1 Tax=Dendryphion nanum TaxID=256645 RepID=A0A9P9DXC8_9PLEO|nr:hypothetical protein B0J11DRAFT_504689 [Dendryphion nanum]
MAKKPTKMPAPGVPKPDDPIIACIHDALDFARSAATGDSSSNPLPSVEIRLTITTHPPSEAIELLRSNPGLSTIISATLDREVHALQIAPSPMATNDPGIGPHWWPGLLQAETRAGPLRDDRSVRKYAGIIKNVNGRRKKRPVTKYEKETLAKLAEGFRRQQANLDMCDDDEEEDNVDEDEEE